jgi:hypothetical protein
MMISRPSLNMGHLRSKIESQEQTIEKACEQSSGCSLIQIFWKFVRKVILIILRSSLNIGHLWSKTRSQGLKIEKTLLKL